MQNEEGSHGTKVGGLNRSFPGISRTNRDRRTWDPTRAVPHSTTAGNTQNKATFSRSPSTGSSTSRELPSYKKKRSHGRPSHVRGDDFETYSPRRSKKKTPKAESNRYRFF